MDGQVSGGEGSMMPTGIGPDGSDKARLAAMEALLAAGAEVDAQNGDGYTALHLASLAIKPKLVAALLEAGARVDLATASHKTALECAEQFADKDAGASAECVRLIEAREKELGLEGRGAGSCFWCCFILKPANICQDRLGPNIGIEGEKDVSAGGAGRYTMDVTSISVNGGPEQAVTEEGVSVSDIAAAGGAVPTSSSSGGAAASTDTAAAAAGYTSLAGSEAEAEVEAGKAREDRTAQLQQQEPDQQQLQPTQRPAAEAAAAAAEGKGTEEGGGGGGGGKSSIGFEMDDKTAEALGFGPPRST